MLERYFGYKPPVPKELQTRYEAALHQVLRWRNGNWDDAIHETNWHHVIDMFRVLEDINKSCPTIFFEIDRKTVQHMIFVHDAGEIIKGDLTHNRSDYGFVYDEWKRKELTAGKWLMRKIEDRYIRTQAMKLYERCMSPQPEDKEALLTDFTDKVQGSRFGFRNVFHGKGMTRANREMQFNHTMQLLTKPAKPLLKLVSPDTQEGLKSFLAEELERFSQYGYKREAALYIKKLSFILQ